MFSFGTVGRHTADEVTIQKNFFGKFRRQTTKTVSRQNPTLSANNVGSCGMALTGTQSLDI